jgi:hypothetical protein
MRRLFVVLPWAVLALVWGFLFYSSLLIPGGAPDVWPLHVHMVMALFLIWVVFSLFVMFLPKTNLKSEKFHLVREMPDIPVFLL